MTDKAPNYTDAQIESLRNVYEPDADEAMRKAQIKDLASITGKSEASVRAKLTHLGLYVPLAKAPAGKGTVRKAELVSIIARKLEMDEDVAGSLEKVTKNVLNRLIEVL